jgi:hypothetical protein
MGVVSIIWSVFAFLFMLLGLIPLLGWLNWAVIPFALLGVVIAALGVAGAKERNRAARIGLVLNLIVAAIATFRLMLGGGII